MSPERRKTAKSKNSDLNSSRSREGLSKRKTQSKRKPFMIDDEFKMEHPVLGGKSSSSFNFSSDIFSSLTTREPSSSLSNPGVSDRGSVVKSALTSSKLSLLDSSSPMEPNPKVGKRKLKAAKRFEKSKTKGSAWYNMAKVEITKEKQNDLEALKLRSAMEGSFHYKRNNITHTPTYFHVGKIVETSADFYSSRIPKKQRKKTLAQEFASEFGM